MLITIDGKFQVTRVFEGKQDFFNSLEEFGVQYPVKIQLATKQNIFQQVSLNDVVDIKAVASMREFQRDGSRSIVFYADSIDFETYKINLTMQKKGGE